MITLIRWMLSSVLVTVVLVLIVVAAVVIWYLQQKKEAEAGDRLRAQDRARGDSIWNDRN